MATKEQIQEVLDDIRPYLQRDGGDVEFVDVTEDGVVLCRLQGSCHGCPYAQQTIKNGIERILQEQYPEITGVESVED